MVGIRKLINNKIMSNVSNISITIIDPNNNNRPISHARIKLRCLNGKLNIEGSTDTNGKFNMYNIPYSVGPNNIDDYEITADRMDYCVAYDDGEITNEHIYRTYLTVHSQGYNFVWKLSTPCTAKPIPQPPNPPQPIYPIIETQNNDEVIDLTPISDKPTVIKPIFPSEVYSILVQKYIKETSNMFEQSINKAKTEPSIKIYSYSNKIIEDPLKLTATLSLRFYLSQFDKTTNKTLYRAMNGTLTVYNVKTNKGNVKTVAKSITSDKSITN